MAKDHYYSVNVYRKGKDGCDINTWLGHYESPYLWKALKMAEEAHLKDSADVTWSAFRCETSSANTIAHQCEF